MRQPRVRDREVADGERIRFSPTILRTWVCKRADLSMLRWSMLRSRLTSMLDSEPWKPAPRDM